MNSPIEKKSARRRRAMIAGAAVLLAVFAGTVVLTPTEAWRTVDIVRMAGFVLLALVLAIRSTTAFSLLGRNPVLDDELTRANRASAARVGFWVLFAGVLICFAVSILSAISFVQAAPILIALGAVSAALRFAMLEGRGVG